MIKGKIGQGGKDRITSPIVCHQKRKRVRKMKRLLLVLMALGMISIGGWSMASVAKAAQTNSKVGYQQGSNSKVDNDQEVNDNQKENENLPGEGHTDQGANTEHQFEGEE